MTLVWLLIVLIAGGILSGLFARWHLGLSRWLALAAVTFDLILTLILAARDFTTAHPVGNQWLEEVNWSWILQSAKHLQTYHADGATRQRGILLQLTTAG